MDVDTIADRPCWQVAVAARLNPAVYVLSLICSHFVCELFLLGCLCDCCGSLRCSMHTLVGELVFRTCVLSNFVSTFVCGVLR